MNEISKLIDDVSQPEKDVLKLLNVYWPSLLPFPQGVRCARFERPWPMKLAPNAHPVG